MLMLFILWNLSGKKHTKEKIQNEMELQVILTQPYNAYVVIV